jgi:copper(I)-binding protein
MCRHIRRGIAAAALLAAALVAPATARDYAIGDLAIQAPWSRATPPAAKVGAGYLSIANRGTSADRLVAAQSPVAGRVEIHEMREGAAVPVTLVFERAGRIDVEFQVAPAAARQPGHGGHGHGHGAPVPAMPAHRH